MTKRSRKVPMGTGDLASAIGMDLNNPENLALVQEVQAEQDRRTPRTTKRVLHATAVELFGEDLSCGDGGCVFGSSGGGMHTNGGCRHLKERDGTELRHTIQRLAVLARYVVERAMLAEVPRRKDVP